MKYETGSGHSIVRDQFPREKMAIGQGMITSMFAGGAVIGLSIGGFIIQHYGWQTNPMFQQKSSEKREVLSDIESHWSETEQY
jgi:hypothetical protein